MSISRVALITLLLVASALPSTAVGQSLTSTAPETVVISSGALRLTALLWRPQGSGPVPAILFSHGSGLRVDARLARARAQAIGPIFAKHGYAFLYLFRRGYGLSNDQGDSLGDVLDREAKARGAEAQKRLQVVLLTTDHLDDEMAGLSFLRSLKGIDSQRIAFVGHSFGGQLALLAAERYKSARAVVTFAAAAQSWDGSSELREHLLAALQNISAPIFLSHAANDYSTAPGRVMAAELERLGRSHLMKIYPPVGNTAATGHEAVYTDIARWEGDVFRFLDEHMRR